MNKQISRSFTFYGKTAWDYLRGNEAIRLLLIGISMFLSVMLVIARMRI